jgi:hypothetical protein
MYSPIRSNNPAANMRRLGAASVLLCLAAMLGACSPFAGYVADHVPHWAGGLPPDAPPRPGAPGYDDFIAHGEPPAPNAPAAGADAVPATGAVGSTGAMPNTAASAPQTKTPAKAPGKTAAKGRNGNVQIGRLQTAPPRPQAEPEAAASADPVEPPTADDPSVVKGGLY